MAICGGECFGPQVLAVRKVGRAGRAGEGIDGEIGVKIGHLFPAQCLKTVLTMTPTCQTRCEAAVLDLFVCWFYLIRFFKIFFVPVFIPAQRNGGKVPGVSRFNKLNFGSARRPSRISLRKIVRKMD